MPDPKTAPLRPATNLAASAPVLDIMMTPT